MMYTIAVGDPWDGIRLFGVYESFNDAERDAYYYFDCQTWWIKNIDMDVAP